MIPSNAASVNLQHLNIISKLNLFIFIYLLLILNYFLLTENERSKINKHYKFYVKNFLIKEFDIKIGKIVFTK
jgi:hypothetical protein